MSDTKQYISQELAVSVRNLTKVYKLYDKHIDRIKESINPFGKQYHRKFSALKNVSIEIKKGEVLGIVGQNGAGKSTLLNIIAGVLTPSVGHVITRGKATALLGLGAGFNPILTGIENIYLNGTIQGYSKEEMDAKLSDILSFADIGDFADQPIKIYSAGMQARLAFAVAINIDPEILIVDEVLAVGDELFRRKCYAKIESFMDQGKTILFVTHNIGPVNELCTRAIFLDRGELILEGPPKLVTIYYQKFLYAKPKDRMRVRDEIILLNQDEEKKKDFIIEIEEQERKKVVKEKEDVVKAEEKAQVSKQKAFYLPGFESKSKVLQRNADIDVYDIHISTLDGKRVNCLVFDEEYFLNYKVRFNEEIENFAFSWAFKNEKGLVLSGIRYPGQKGTIDKAAPNEIYLLKWKFRCTLLQGIYYIDIGIPKLVGGVREILLANYDIMAFKVEKSEHDEKGEFTWAIFNMEQKIETIEILS